MALPPVRFFFERVARASAPPESAADRPPGASPADPASGPVGDRDLAHPASSQLDLFGD